MSTDVTAPPFSERLDAIAARYAARGDTIELRAAVRDDAGRTWAWTEPDARARFAAASVTKLATAALVLGLVDRGLLRLDMPATAVIGRDALDGLHVRRGLDARPEITVARLLDHSSGIADYFSEPGVDGRTLQRSLLEQDEAWTAREAIDRARGTRPHGRPGSRLAHYSDTNYRLLELIIEEREHAPYAEVVRARIAEPLGLEDTFILTPATLDRFTSIAPVRTGAARLELPLALASAGADGSLVSTAADLLDLLDAFFGARLFSSEMLARATSDWRWMTVPPGRYGLGVMEFRMADARRPFTRAARLLGHSGITGAVAFRAPDLGLSVVAGVNQFTKPSLAYRFMSELVAAAR